MMTSAQVVVTSVTTTDNSPSQDYNHPDDQTTLLHVFVFLTIKATIATIQLQRGRFVTLSNKFASETMAGVLGRFSFATAAEKQLKQRKHCQKHCFLVVGLEKVVFREGNCQGNRKLRADPA